MSTLFHAAWRGVAGFMVGLLLSSAVYAGDIQIENIWAFATSTGKETANVYMQITSKQAAALVDASSPKSKTVELRTMLHKTGMMKTIQVKTIDLLANIRTDMTSEHGYHLTLISLKSPLVAGVTVPLTLKFKQADQRLVTVDVQVAVRPSRGPK